MIYLGIDTSNYKTSIAAVDERKRILKDISEYLEVPQGMRGLRQSDAFFKHSNKLPELLSDMFKDIDIKDISAVSVSERPRRVEDSYMPCFLAGLNLAKVLSDTLSVPLYTFSHQEGHAAAIIESGSEAYSQGNSLLMHLSGGTTEILNCSQDECGYSMDIIGGTMDISIGQLLDRFGVALGFPFPAGMYIDELASAYQGSRLPGIVPGIRIMDGYFNLSGPENILMRFASEYTEKHAEEQNTGELSIVYTDELASVSYELMDRISDVLLISARLLFGTYNSGTVYMAGGVASSAVLRKMIKEKSISENFRIIFGDPALSGDNAVGTALLARRIHTGR